MSRARVLAILSTLPLALGLGLAASAPASAAPQLSTGCAQVHSHLGQTFSSSFPVQFAAAPYSAGEQLVIIGFASPGGLLDIAIGDSSGQGIHLSGSPGQKIRIPVTVSDSYTFRLSGIDAEGEPANVTWTADCGVPPNAVIASPAGGQTYTVGQQVPTFFGCGEQTNPVGTCVDSNGSQPPAGALDTSTAGPHTYSVTATDSSGLVRKTSISYTVAKATQTISFATSAPANAVVFEGPYFAGATATSGLPVIFSADPSSAGVCSVLPGPGGSAAVSFDGAGTCTINADQAGNDQYQAAPRVSQSFVIHKTPTSLSAVKACKCLGITPSTFKATLSWSHPMGPGTITEGLPGQTVSFAVKGKTVCSAVTDTNGLATCKATLGLGVALTASSYTATYAGDARFEASTDTAKLE